MNEVMKGKVVVITGATSGIGKWRRILSTRSPPSQTFLPPNVLKFVARVTSLPI
jgi:hypothetical protein